MSTPRRHGRISASVALAAVVLAASNADLRAQERMNAEARVSQRESAQALQFERAVAGQRSQLERARAHARMPSTMYASTPDPAPPHAFPPVPAPARQAPSRPAPLTETPVERTHRILLFPSSSRWTEGGYQGFARVTNHSDEAGEVDIEAFDDEGTAHRPVTLRIGAGESVHFNSDDLERGNAPKGLSGAAGTGEGDWRLELSSTLELEVLAYIRTTDGLLTAMHDRVPASGGEHRVAIFNPGRNVNQVSRLRLVNPGSEPAEVRIEAVDDRGASGASVVGLSVPAGAARTVSAHELENGGAGFSGALGPGRGKWRLVVRSEQALEVMSLLSSPTGHRTNLSTSPARAVVDDDAVVYTVPLFPSAARWTRDGVQGFVRVINYSATAGTVRIEGFDDEGTPAAPVSLDISANTVVHFNSEDLEHGNVGKGISAGIGAGTGEWHLRLRSTLELEVLAYIRTTDGFLTSVHDLVPGTAEGHRVAVFNPGSNANQVSRLRLINPGDAAATVRIEGIDDRGDAPGGSVRLDVPARGARTVTAHALESGEGVDGALGDGAGKWRLTLTADRPIEAMSLLSSPTGHLTNLSTSTAVESAAKLFRERISGPIVQAKCIACHVQGGLSGNTRLVFVPASTPNHFVRNLKVFEDFLHAVDGVVSIILNKIQGVSHGGGTPVPAGTPEFADMQRFLALLGEDVAAAPITPQNLFDTVWMAPTRKTLRRAALIFAGRTPTDDEYAAAERGTTALRATIRGLMTGPEFHEFLIRGANDRLLTDRDIVGILNAHGYFVDFTNENYRRAKAVLASGTPRARRDYEEWGINVQYGARRAPLELIAHVVENDRPYTEVLTADYIMANPMAAGAYGAPTRFDDPENMHEFKPSRVVSYYRHGEGLELESDPVVGVNRVLNPGPLITDYPHAGILNTKVFLQRYPTTATNRNRARSRWTYYHFLGIDVEKSASRTTDPVALADTNNPTLRNPACTVCHRVLDPVAGAFQNYGDAGLYKDQFGGVDSLDHFYKVAGEERVIRADSWEDREALSWSVFLAAGVQTLRVRYANDYYDPDTGDDGWIFLDRLRVTDARGGMIVSHEFEDLGPPVPSPDFGCGHQGYNPAGRNDHVGLFSGGTSCAIYIDVDVPRDGVYEVEIVAWMNGRHELYGEDGFAKLAVAANAYQEGDTWYRDMREPGFAGELALNSDNSVQWLARRLIADERFAEAAVKFWWPAIMGSEVAQPPEDERDADFEGLLLAANAQGAEVARLARGFQYGFRGGQPFNLKDLLVEIVLSKWFRADAVEDDHPVRRVALHDAGARRLLTPEELDRKTAAITGYRWGRTPRISHAYRGLYSRLTDDYRLLYGGIDSDGVTERARDVTSVMAGVAKRHAAQVSCPVVIREFFLVPDAERRLFAGLDRLVSPELEFGTSFEIEAASRDRKETLALTGELSAGAKIVSLSYSNEYWRGENDDRNVHLDRLDVRGPAGAVVASIELEGLPEGDCRGPTGDDHTLWCESSLEVPIEIPTAGKYTIEIVAWGDQAGGDLPRLAAAVEDAGGTGAGARAIRSKLVELHNKLLGVQVTAQSPDVEAAYRLFVDEMERKRETTDTWFEWWECEADLDRSYLEGILDDAVMEYESEDGWRTYGFDWDRVEDFMDGVDFSDPHGAAQAWVVVLAYLMMDYRYLYL